MESVGFAGCKSSKGTKPIPTERWGSRASRILRPVGRRRVTTKRQPRQKGRTTITTTKAAGSMQSETGAWSARSQKAAARRQDVETEHKGDDVDDEARRPVSRILWLVARGRVPHPRATAKIVWTAERRNVTKKKARTTTTPTELEGRMNRKAPKQYRKPARTTYAKKTQKGPRAAVNMRKPW